jgi:endonuclease-8
MPEGPEIRLAADMVAQIVENNVIEDIEVGLPSLTVYRDALVGSSVTRVETRGKALLTHFDIGLTIYSHNQLYGKWFTEPRGSYPTTNRKLRLALHTHTNSALLYSASDISVWPTPDIEQHPLIAKLGPDILDHELTPYMLVKRMMSKRFVKRSLSALYLDQGFIAGSGNYLRSEILFAANIHQDCKPCDLSEQQLFNLADATLAVTQRSYHTQGYTIPDDLYAQVDKLTSDYEGTRFMVFDREAKACRVCSTPIEKATRNGRRIYWCPNCQPQHR